MAPLAEELIVAAGVAGRICIGLVFLAAAVQKFSHWRILPGVIANYRLLPRALVQPVSVLLPPLELILGALLLSGLAQGWTALAAMAFLAVFAAAMAVNLRRGRAAIDCGCGQSFLKQTLSWSLIARNAVLAALLLPSLGASAPVSTPNLVAGCGAGLAFALLYLVASTISALPRPV
jgi:uncharacterized membrane protein YphA (DoxX/SURF4 family)